MADTVQPTGQTAYRKVIFGTNGKSTYTHKNLSAQRNKRLVTAGGTGFPIPFRVPPITSFIPQIKYVLETRIIFCCAYFKTARDELIIPASCREKTADKIPKLAPNKTVISVAFFKLSRTLLSAELSLRHRVQKLLLYGSGSRRVPSGQASGNGLRRFY